MAEFLIRKKEQLCGICIAPAAPATAFTAAEEPLLKKNTQSFFASRRFTQRLWALFTPQRENIWSLNLLYLSILQSFLKNVRISDGPL